ncbi:MAG: LmeA family phospholipid-binding protein [Fimbriimonadaceae bacterium]
MSLRIGWREIGIGLIVLFGLGEAEVRSFERRAAADIAAQLDGPDRRVRVRSSLAAPLSAAWGDIRRVEIEAERFSTEGLPLFTEPHRSAKGRIGELNLQLREFRLRGLAIERLDASIPGCRFDHALAVSKRQIRLSRSGEGRGSVRVRQEDLEAWIVGKFVEIKRATVSLANGRAVVEGYGEFLVIATEFRVDARIEAPDGRRLALVDANITFDGRPADPLSSQALLQSLNPVVDLDEDLGLYGAVDVTEIRLENGYLEAFGTTRIPTRPESHSRSAG